MSETLRLFVAIDLPDEVQTLLADLQQALRATTNTVRWADPHGTHLTLKFLGEVNRSDRAAVEAGMRSAAARSDPFALRTGDLGMFPNARQPRVIWLGLDGERTALHTLQQSVEAEIAPLGFPTEARPFRPHLTLGRTHPSATDRERDLIGQAVRSTPVPRCISFNVASIVLMRSERLPTGARYTVIGEAALRADR